MNFNLVFSPKIDKVLKTFSREYKSGHMKPARLEVYKKLNKTLDILEKNPRHPGLHSHPNSSVSKWFGYDVWQSYIENRNSLARRLFWLYDPEVKGQIFVIGYCNHPESKNNDISPSMFDDMGKESLFYDV